MDRQTNKDSFFPLDYDFVFKLNESNTLDLDELKHSDILASPFKDTITDDSKSTSND